MRFRGYLFDLDGTIYRGDQPIPGAVEAVRWLRDQGAIVRYVTNNSTQTRDHFARKLQGMGFPCSPYEIVSSGAGTGRYLSDERVRNAFVVGEPGLAATLQEYGIRVVPSGEPSEAVVVGLCRTFTYDLLREAMTRIGEGARFVATNTDATLPLEGGRLIPGAGSIVAAVRTASGVEPFVVGKPNPYLVFAALEEAGLRPSEALVVGDRMDTDIESGRRAGCETFLVLTGVEKTLPDGQAGAADLSGLP